MRHVGELALSEQGMRERLRVPEIVDIRGLGERGVDDRQRLPCGFPRSGFVAFSVIDEGMGQRVGGVVEWADEGAARVFGHEIVESHRSVEVTARDGALSVHLPYAEETFGRVGWDGRAPPVIRHPRSALQVIDQVHVCLQFYIAGPYLDEPLAKLACLVELTERAVTVRQAHERRHIARIDRNRALEQRHAFVPAQVPEQHVGQPDQRVNVVRRYRENFAIRLLGLALVIERAKVVDALLDLDLRVVGREGECAFHCFHRLGAPRRSLVNPVSVGASMLCGEPCPCEGEVRVQVHRFLKRGDAFLHAAGRAHSARCLVGEILMLEEEVVSLEVLGRALGKPGLFLGIERYAERARDLRGELALDGEDVLQLAVVALRPQVLVGIGVDQLRRNAHLVPGAAHAAFEEGGHAKLGADLAAVYPGIAVFENRGARHDLEITQQRELRQQVFVDAIGEEGHVLVFAQVGERQHGERFAFRHTECDARRRAVRPVPAASSSRAPSPAGTRRATAYARCA